MIMPGFWKIIEKYNDEQVDEATFTVAALCNCPIFLYETYEDPTVEAEFVGRCFELGLEGISKREMKRIRCPVVTGLPVQLHPGAFWEVIFKVRMEQNFKIIIYWMVSKTLRQ